MQGFVDVLVFVEVMEWVEDIVVFNMGFVFGLFGVRIESFLVFLVFSFMLFVGDDLNGLLCLRVVLILLGL